MLPHSSPQCLPKCLHRFSGEEAFQKRTIISSQIFASDFRPFKSSIFIVFEHFQSRSGYKDQHVSWLSTSPSVVWQVSLVAGRLTLFPTLHLYLGFVHMVI